MCVCKIKEIHPQTSSGIKTRTDKQTAEQQDDQTDVGLPPPELRQAGDKKLGVRNNILMRDVIGKVILNTHLFLSKSEQNKSSKVAVATILKKEANLPIFQQIVPTLLIPPSPPPPQKKLGEDRYLGT